MAASHKRLDRRIKAHEVQNAKSRIKALEDALAEYQRLGKIISESVIPCLTVHGNCDQCRPKTKAACEAIAAIHKGKIGPDAAKPQSWQITEERKAAIWHAVAVLKENDPDDEHLWDEEIAVLRAMLREAE